MRKRRPSYIVIGGGLAGLAATMKLCEDKAKVTLVSYQPVKRSHSVCAQGGINAAIDTKGEGDSPETHFYDTVKGGDFLANQPLVRDMCHQAPAIIHLMDRLGVAFNRTPEGHLEFRRFGGTLYSRTAFAGAHDLRSGEIFTVKGDAVVLATGGPAQVYGKTTGSTVCNGVATTSAYLQGAKYANGEFIQVHPTAIPGQDKLRLMSESARGEGGRIWVPRKPNDDRDPLTIPEEERYYFLEENYPLFGNLVPRDVASREIHNVVYNKELGVGGQPMVYLDLTHQSEGFLETRLGGILDIYTKFTGDDPKKVPMKIFPAVHYSMGGIWTDYEDDGHGLIDHHSPRNQMTSIQGLYAAGECDYQFHGANRLGANSLLSCIYTGLMMGPGMIRYSQNLRTHFEDVPSTVFDQARDEWKEKFADFKKKDGKENPYTLHQDLGSIMLANVLIVRENAKLENALTQINDLETRFRDVKCLDTTHWSNPAPSMIQQLNCQIQLAKIITQGALTRNEFRGAHYKPEYDLNQPANFDPHEYVEYIEKKQYGEIQESDFPTGHSAYMKRYEECNEQWLKTTIAEHKNDQPAISFEEVNTSLIQPRPRKYD